MFLPTTRKEMDAIGLDSLDVILVTGDSYIDSPYIGIAVIGKLLVKHGYRVGIIAQPNPDDLEDIGRLGEPALFWGVTAGCVDSMVANYTALKKKRRSDDYTPGGVNDRRPDRASIVYSNLIRRWSNQDHPQTSAQPIVLGGIEASLRRVAHYDFWSDRLRRSLLFDAKADYLLYGMAEQSILDLSTCLKNGDDSKNVRGLCYISYEKPVGFLDLPSFEEVVQDKAAFTHMFHSFYRNNDPLNAKGLTQKHADRYLIQNPPSPYPTQTELDEVYSLDYEYKQHPFYEKNGPVKALETIRFSISTHRGCYGECNFCAIAVHEGRTIRWRSKESILAEAELLTQQERFKGYIQDLGGPTANMYGYECAKKLKSGSCQNRRCLSPVVCPVLKVNHLPNINLLKQVRKIKGIKKVFISSGIRYDLLFSDGDYCDDYMHELVNHHVSGQLKVAPEHSQANVLDKMGKPGNKNLLRFKEKFDEYSKSAGKNQYLTYYMIAAHPGCDEIDMQNLKAFSSKKLNINPEQVQIFTPTPSTYSTLMYYTEQDPFTGEPIFVEKNPERKQKQKKIVVHKNG
ncbi:MAG: YgiQ family radical SAM protein [Chloroflexi bacterium GWB2_49_20]|nr:MAG: YgiQ family radical SAM protein [Chloroflexi bacterium GWB2_49_20]OGN80032.1 MAG: YgiQ family radical SAM protein [Chloroflexi bacterium GWC2_49_37]OGN85432.1 MAG: YgiQ family radical SAM protein [Chloroflexi bacterium GWD2_49_16]HBG74293.1 YgiQ family radical SAM protein [Anaerolineae bacterium]HCM97097.1 YgiQ family radical SAM protein [Anaerolineae bacterium]